ncbi:MAG: hypothetical protein ABJA66_16915, partial [Actinomycetota bacterium]
RAGQPNSAASSSSLESFINIMDNLGKQKANPQSATTPVVADSSGKPLGDLSAFRKIAEDMSRLVNAGDLKGAKSRAGDLESAWDNAQPKLRPMNQDKWTAMDNAIDDVLKQIRSSKPNAATSSSSLDSLIGLINNLDNQK